MYQETIKYTSTRGQDPRVYEFTDALLTGTATDGGLLVPPRDALPKISIGDLGNLRPLTYAQRVGWIVNLFKPDLDPEAIAEDVARAYAYGENFDDTRIAPVVDFKPDRKQYMQELWHGSTAAFKDMALQLLPLLFTRAAGLDNSERVRNGEPPLHYLILVATSGDTGASAAVGFRDLPYLSVIVNYPNQHRVSKLQELKMTTQEGDNVGVYAMDGDFDAVQEAVKNTFMDEELRQFLRDLNIVLSSANSINLGRVLPQLAYHVSGYVDLMNQGVISPGEKIDMAIPTGNCGNLLSALYAKKMGLPVNRLICASNANNALAQFLRTGTYDLRNRELERTPSPSMDILLASNIERILHLLTGDPLRVGRWMEELKTERTFTVDPETADKLRENFYSGSVSNEQCLKNILIGLKKTGYLMDPHTSVAQFVAERYQEEERKKGHVLRTVIVSSTAHWAKFPRTILEALEVQPDDPGDEFAAVRQILRLIPGATVPESITSLEGKKVLHTKEYPATAEGLKAAIHGYLDTKFGIPAESSSKY